MLLNNSNNIYNKLYSNKIYKKTQTLSGDFLVGEAEEALGGVLHHLLGGPDCDRENRRNVHSNVLRRQSATQRHFDLNRFL